MTVRRWICGVAVCAAASGACFFEDLFGPAGSGLVTFQWSGDSVLSVGVPRPFTITVLIDGVPTTYPVTLAIPDTTVITFATTPDSVVGKRPGQGHVVASIRSSLSPSIDTSFRVRVTGGPPSGP